MPTLSTRHTLSTLPAMPTLSTLPPLLSRLPPGDGPRFPGQPCPKVAHLDLGGFGDPKHDGDEDGDNNDHSVPDDDHTASRNALEQQLPWAARAPRQPCSCANSTSGTAAAGHPQGCDNGQVWVDPRSGLYSASTRRATGTSRAAP